MTAEPIQKVMQLWQDEKITEEQVIGKVLVWLHTLYAENQRLRADLSQIQSHLALQETKPRPKRVVANSKRRYS